MTAVISDESGFLDERIIFWDLIDEFYGSLRRLLDIFDIGGADRHIIFVIDISGIIRHVKISGILLELGIGERIVTEVVNDAFYLARRDDIDTRARKDERI